MVKHELDQTPLKILEQVSEMMKVNIVEINPNSYVLFPNKISFHSLSVLFSSCILITCELYDSTLRIKFIESNDKSFSLSRKI